MTSVPVLPDPDLPWPMAWEGVKLIAMREGLRLKAYQCSAGVWTGMWGETVGIREGQTWTKEEADHKLLDELDHYVERVSGMCRVTPNANQLCGLVSLAYNIGLRDDKKKAGLYWTTVLHRHNEGDFDSAARAFVLINEFTNPTTHKREVSTGLTLRRKQESALYLTPVPNEVGAESIDMPQEVLPENTIAKSPINVAGAATALTGASGLLSSFTDNADKVSASVDKVSATVSSAKTATVSVKGILSEADLTPVEVFGGIALIAGLVIMHFRAKQRSKGFA